MKEYEIDKDADFAGQGYIASEYMLYGLVGTTIYRVQDGFIATWKEGYAIYGKEEDECMDIALNFLKDGIDLKIYLKSKDENIVKYKFKKKRKKFWLFGKLF